jgi:Flp pilus assembly protein TadG
MIDERRIGMTTGIRRLGHRIERIVRNGGDRGASAVEFALVLPILLLIVFGIVDFGRAYNAQIALSEAAAQGARVLALGGTSAQAQAAAKSSLDGSSVAPGDVSFPTLTACPADGSGTGQAVIKVQDANFTFVTPFISSMFGSGITLTGVGARQCGS